MPIQRITSGIIADGAIVATDIGDGIVTANKIASLTSSELSTIVSDGTGSGNVVFGESPTLTNILLNRARESANISATAADGTVTLNTIENNILYLTANATNNIVINITGNSSIALNDFLSTGESFTTALLVTNGSSPSYPTAINIDGTDVTTNTKWQGGDAPTSGNADAVDVYTFSIFKTANASFTVFAAQTQFG